MSDEISNPRKTSSWAIASLVCGVLGLVIGVVSILAVIFGHMAKSEIARSPEIEGSGMATVGLVSGYIGLVLLIISIISFIGFGKLIIFFLLWLLF